MMTNTQHTPGPWKIDDQITTIRDEPGDDGNFQTLMLLAPDPDDAESIGIAVAYVPLNNGTNSPDAERIVACVNAMDGIADPAAYIRFTKNAVPYLDRLIGCIGAWKQKLYNRAFRPTSKDFVDFLKALEDVEGFMYPCPGEGVSVQQQKDVIANLLQRLEQQDAEHKSIRSWVRSALAEVAEHMGLNAGEPNNPTAEDLMIGIKERWDEVCTPLTDYGALDRTCAALLAFQRAGANILADRLQRVQGRDPRGVFTQHVPPDMAEKAMVQRFSIAETANPNPDGQ